MKRSSRPEREVAVLYCTRYAHFRVFVDPNDVKPYHYHIGPYIQHQGFMDLCTAPLVVKKIRVRLDEDLAEDTTGEVAA